MDWFSRHTNWLYRETRELSNNFIYRESYQFIGKTLVSTGNILVHKAKTQYHPILIVYPEATPFVPPIIYILNEELSEDTTREYSELLPGEIGKRIKSNIRFLNRRHQNEDGSICFVEMGDLHDETAEFYSIEDIIKRLRKWLSGEIPKDSREVELFHHFPKRTYEIQYLLPDLFFDIEIIKGKFFAGLSSLIPANFFPDGIGKKTFVGVLIFGKNPSGVWLPPKIYVNEQLILFTHIPDVRRLILEENNQEKLNKIRSGDLIEGNWWDISEEPQPFTDLNTLAEYVGNGDRVKGLDELLELSESSLRQLEEVIHIGIRFPGRWREKDWQMFRLRKGTRPPIVPTTKEELKERLLDYSIQAVYQEYFTDEYFHLRNRGRAERSALKDVMISIIGCGALGSETSDALSKAGVGKILLVDKEDMRAHNAVRHCLGINRTSLPKALAMAEHLLFHNPFVSVTWAPSNILLDKLENYLPSGSIGVSTIADDNIEAYLNEQAINGGRTVFYCRALRGGKVARIFRVIPQTDACKGCLALYSKERNPLFIEVKEDETLPALTNECNNPVRPGSAADMKMIAAAFARVVIEFLQGESREKNHWILSMEPLERIQFEDFTHGVMQAHTIPPHPNCPVCQRLEAKKVYTTREVYDLMKQESADSKDVETGGVLIGYREGPGRYVIIKATGPGPKAIRTKTRFEKDEEYCQKELIDAFSQLAEKGLYLGEWHYHPVGSNEPSGLDIRSLTEIAAQSNYRIDRPIMIIMSPNLECAITIHDKSGRCVQLPLEVCEAT